MLFCLRDLVSCTVKGATAGAVLISYTVHELLWNSGHGLCAVQAYVQYVDLHCKLGPHIANSTRLDSTRLNSTVFDSRGLSRLTTDGWPHSPDWPWLSRPSYRLAVVNRLHKARSLWKGYKVRQGGKFLFCILYMVMVHGSHAQQKKENGGCFGGSFVFEMPKATLKCRKGKLWSRSWLLWRRDCGQYQKLCRKLETEDMPSFVNYCRLTARTVQLPFPPSKSLTRDLSPIGLHVLSCYFLIGWAWSVRWIA